MLKPHRTPVENATQIGRLRRNFMNALQIIPPKPATTVRNGVPVWVCPPPIIYGPGPEARAPYAIDPADGMKRQDWMSLAATTGMREHVVEAPGAALNGGKQALYAILDSVW
jgi:hypothetical protein